MARYLVVHAPKPAWDQESETIAAPTRMLDLATDSGIENANPRWIMTMEPDLNDDRMFTLWEADDPALILDALTTYGFLDHLDATPIRVDVWGPDEVIAATGGG